MARVFDELKCVVCGCTDEHGCDEGCSWFVASPPVCSSCVARFMFAKLWAFVFASEGRAKGEVAKLIGELRMLYGFISEGAAGDVGIPTLKQICQINRNASRWHEKNPPAKKRREGARKRGLIRSLKNGAKR